MTELDDLIQTQHVTGGLISRFWTNVEKIGKANLTLTVLESREDLLQAYWNKYFDTHLRISQYEGHEDDVYTTADHFSMVEEAFLCAKAKLATAKGSTPGPTIRSRSTSGVEAALIHQLPKLNMPTFSGDPLMWETFRDRFKVAVHDVPSLSPGTKLQHLQGCLQGEAAKLVNHLPATDANYEGVWEKLEKRYGNKRLLIRTHLKNLLSMPGTTKGTSTELKTILDTTDEAVRALKALGRPTDQWNDWLVHIVVERLDNYSRVAWEVASQDTPELPTYTQLSSFLEARIQALSATHLDKPPTKSSSSSSSDSKRRSTTSTNQASTTKTSKPKQTCTICQGPHFFSYCPKFRKLSPAQRKEQVEKFNLCCNCLKSNHVTNDCPSDRRCLACNLPHHTMLHAEATTPTAANGNLTQQPKNPGAAGEAHQAAQSSASVLTTRVSEPVLTSTAIIILESATGHTLTCRALLDTGAERSFTTERVAQHLRLSRRPTNVTISGFGDTDAGTARSQVSLFLRSKHRPDFRLALNTLVVPKLTSLLPARNLKVREWPHLVGLPLADPEFDKARSVDVILGADVYGILLLGGVRTGPVGTPTAHETTLGWVLTGRITDERSDKPLESHRLVSLHCATNTTITDQLKRHWELEEVTSQRPPSVEDEKCETHYERTKSRTDSGQYVVKLPFREDPALLLGDSRQAALRMLQQSERRQQTDPQLASAYSVFMSDYLNLGHMELAESLTMPVNYYMPHHAVTKRHDPTKKIRVVFNASYRPANGHSLNDLLLPGPKLQKDLWAIVSRWRLRQFVFTADVVKMYRQILIHPDDVDWQRILWRPNKSQDVQDYRLLTVTYGTTSAPYLAIRTLTQLAHDEGTRFPEGAKALLTDTYVDDILTGANTLEEALSRQQQLIELLRAGHFELGKWAANVDALIPPSTGQPSFASERTFKAEEEVSTLGIRWDTKGDSFHYKVDPFDDTSPITKRQILSEIARLFDPLGWVSPVCIAAKIMLQDLWILGSDWDSELPQYIRESWTRFRSQLHQLETIRVPRWFHTNGTSTTTQIHGFSDASERAYAAAVYLRVTDGSGVTHTSLIIAKSKVAPVQVVSLPRLELCGALLLARLLTVVLKALELPDVPVFCWSDSTVTLAWLRQHASKWKTFVANRVSEIQQRIPQGQWRHVPSAFNPADYATRGISPNALQDANLWWRGPSWLPLDCSAWPQETANLTEDVDYEARPSPRVLIAQPVDLDTITTRYSSYFRLLRTAAYCFRFIDNLRKVPAERTKSFLTKEELAVGEKFLIRQAQQVDFQTELRALNAHQPLPRTSTLLCLSPYVDESGILRVGGRLNNAFLPFNEKHPILLAKDSQLTLLLVRQAHQDTLHGGPQLMQSYLLRKFWIVRGRTIIKKVCRTCVRCIRFRAAPQEQLMGQLPAARVQPNRPFHHTGVDYAGPVQVRTTKGRGHKSHKGYICLFVCLVTRAIHLELVSDYTSASFIAAFRRFISRRGPPATMMSDNGTTFKGADKELKQMFRDASDYYTEVAPALALQGTTWIFIPPQAPHFGGIWEAGVRAVKHHLRRVIGDSTLTFEELTTLLCQVEGCLNSRLLCPLSEDPSDLAALTPGHFLMGCAPTSLPEPSLLTTNDTLLTRWRRINKMRDHFWHRWSSEYLHHLQQRAKWVVAKRNLQVGDLVLQKDDLQPPARWNMARVIDVHPGADGLLRVATIKTAQSTYKRPITKLCLLLPAEPRLPESVTAGGYPPSLL